MRTADASPPPSPYLEGDCAPADDEEEDADELADETADERGNGAFETPPPPLPPTCDFCLEGED